MQSEEVKEVEECLMCPPGLTTAVHGPPASQPVSSLHPTWHGTGVGVKGDCSTRCIRWISRIMAARISP